MSALAALPFQPPLGPMLARAAESIPEGEGWLYEPKWDGFRTIVYANGADVYLESRQGQPLQRYFPELLPLLHEALPERCVVDGELVIAGPSGLDFDALQQRIHPAASRISLLAKTTPVSLIVFDLLALGDRDLRSAPLLERTAILATVLRPSDRVLLTPQTDDPALAQQWLAQFEGAGLDGIVAKRADLPYRPGERTMIKIKHRRTADCVVGGFRVGKKGEWPASLLLGLYDQIGILHYVGHTASFTAPHRREYQELLEPLRGGESFGAGRTPGALSRWSGQHDTSWTPVTPELVCEVSFDQVTGDRFRHATRLLRWRHDKPPAQCSTDQMAPAAPFPLAAVVAPKS